MKGVRQRGKQDMNSAWVVITYAMDPRPGEKCLHKGVSNALAEEFKVSKNITGELWKRFKEQLAEGHTLST